MKNKIKLHEIYLNCLHQGFLNDDCSKWLKEYYLLEAYKIITIDEINLKIKENENENNTRHRF